MVITIIRILKYRNIIELLVNKVCNYEQKKYYS